MEQRRRVTEAAPPARAAPEAVRAVGVGSLAASAGNAAVSRMLAAGGPRPPSAPLRNRLHGGEAVFPAARLQRHVLRAPAGGGPVGIAPSPADRRGATSDALAGAEQARIRQVKAAAPSTSPMGIVPLRSTGGSSGASTLQRLATTTLEAGAVFECEKQVDVWRVKLRAARLATLEKGDPVDVLDPVEDAYREAQIPVPDEAPFVVVRIGQSYGAAPRSMIEASGREPGRKEKLLGTVAGGLTTAAGGIGGQTSQFAGHSDDLARALDMGSLKSLNEAHRYVDREGNTTFKEWDQKHNAEVAAGATNLAGNVVGLVALGATLLNWRQLSGKQRAEAIFDASVKTVSTASDITKIIDSSTKARDNSGGAGDEVKGFGTGYDTFASDAAAKIIGNAADFTGILVNGKRVFEDGKKAWETWRGEKDKDTGERIESSRGEKAADTLALATSSAELAQSAAATARGLIFTITNTYALEAVQMVPILGILVSALKLVIRGWYFIKSHRHRAKMRHQKRDEKRALAQMVKKLDFETGDKRNWKLGDVDFAKGAAGVRKAGTAAIDAVGDQLAPDQVRRNLAEAGTMIGKVADRDTWTGRSGLLTKARKKLRKAGTGVEELMAKVPDPGEALTKARRRIVDGVTSLQDLELDPEKARDAARSAGSNVSEAVAALRGFGRKELGSDLLHKEVELEIGTVNGDPQRAAELKRRLVNYEMARELESINKKREIRAGADITLEFVKIAGDIATLSGYGAGAGVGLKAGASAAGLLMEGTRYGKQAMRDLAAKKDAPALMGKIFTGKTSKEKKRGREELADRIYDRIIAAAEAVIADRDSASAQTEVALIQDQLRATGLSFKSWAAQAIRDPDEARKMLLTALAERQ